MGNGSSANKLSIKQQLDIAIRELDVVKVKSLVAKIKKGDSVDPNAKPWASMSTGLVGAAILEGRLKESGSDFAVAKILIKEGADVLDEDAAKITPIVSAVDADSLEMTKLLLDTMRGKLKMNEKQMTIVHRAADSRGNSCLHIAVTNNNLEIVNALLEAGADPNAQNKRGRTPMDIKPKKNVDGNRTKQIMDALSAKGGSSSRPAN
jgi:ankyrin repeat protein